MTHVPALINHKLIHLNVKIWSYYWRWDRLLLSCIRTREKKAWMQAVMFIMNKHYSVRQAFSFSSVLQPRKCEVDKTQKRLNTALLVYGWVECSDKRRAVCVVLLFKDKRKALKMWISVVYFFTWKKFMPKMRLVTFLKWTCICSFLKFGWRKSKSLSIRPPKYTFLSIYEYLKRTVWLKMDN